MVRGRVRQCRVQDDIEDRRWSQDDDWRYVGSAEDGFASRTVVKSRVFEWECW